MIDDLFVPDPPAGDSSNRLPTTRFVQNVAASATVSGPSIAGLSILGNASTVVASAAAITGAANQMLAVNAAATTVLFTSVSSFIDSAIASTQGAILYRNAATWVALGPGTQSSFLQTQGAAANPQWASGALVLLNTLTPNNVATTGDTTSLTATYRVYKIIFRRLIPATNGAALVVLVHSGGIFPISGYQNSGGANAPSPVAFVSYPTANLQFSYNVATDTTNGISSADPGISGEITVYDPSSAKIATWTAMTAWKRAADASMFGATAAGAWTTAAAVDGFQFAFNTGNITSGTIEIYGIT